MSIIKNLARITVPFVGGKLIGKFAVKNARKDYKKNIKPPFSPQDIYFQKFGLSYMQAWVLHIL